LNRTAKSKIRQLTIKSIGKRNDIRRFDISVDYISVLKPCEEVDELDGKLQYLIYGKMNIFIVDGLLK